METTEMPLIHEPDYQCDGKQLLPILGPNRCEECGIRLCACQTAYGHDCE